MARGSKERMLDRLELEDRKARRRFGRKERLDRAPFDGLDHQRKGTLAGVGLSRREITRSRCRQDATGGVNGLVTGKRRNHRQIPIPQHLSRPAGLMPVLPNSLRAI